MHTYIQIITTVILTDFKNMFWNTKKIIFSCQLLLLQLLFTRGLKYSHETLV